MKEVRVLDEGTGVIRVCLLDNAIWADRDTFRGRAGLGTALGGGGRGVASGNEDADDDADGNQHEECDD